jgi:xanthine dehydrogenase molybdopterin-binding subunit B
MLTTLGRKPSWHELIEAALTSGIDLQARARIYPGPNQNGPFQYLSFAAAVTEVEVDILTGDTRILRGDILLDCGKSLNPAIDIGQVHGAYVQGIGYYLSEEYQIDAANGKLTTNSTWNYKVPSSKDIPHDFRASLLPNSSNPSGFLRSKFSGEPPYGTACSVLFAVQQAVAAGREEIGANDWCSLSAPATVEKVALAANVPTSFLSLPLQSQ